MAVYKIYPSKDASIYSRYPNKNSGIDEILEISSKNSVDYYRYLSRKGVMLEKSPYFNYDFPYMEYNNIAIDEPVDDIRRSLIQFSEADLNIIKSFNSSSYEANVRLFLAFAQNLSTDYTLLCMPLSQSWDMGTGRFSDTPETQNGVNWEYVGVAGFSGEWNPTSGSMYYYLVSGGGTWNNSLMTTQSFTYDVTKDLNINVNPIINYWFNNANSNKGLILKHENAVESNPASYIDLKFYSAETHTIYTPYLEFKWDDSVYNPTTGSGSVPRFSIDNGLSINIENNKGSYKLDSEYTFRIKARDKYPTRQFTTSSVYLNWRYLMEDTQWAIQDEKTGEMVVDFDEDYTKVSADFKGNLFKVYMKGLHPERYYKILIRTKILDTNQQPLSLFSDTNSIMNALAGYTPQQLAALPYYYVTYDEGSIFKIIK